MVLSLRVFSSVRGGGGGDTKMLRDHSKRSCVCLPGRVDRRRQVWMAELGGGEGQGKAEEASIAVEA